MTLFYSLDGVTSCSAEHFHRVTFHLDETMKNMGKPDQQRLEVMRFLSTWQIGPHIVPSSSLYHRIGAATAVDATVNEFYERIMADETLTPLMLEWDMDRWKEMLKVFLTMAFGGDRFLTVNSDRELRRLSRALDKFQHETKEENFICLG